MHLEESSKASERTRQIQLAVMVFLRMPPSSRTPLPAYQLLLLELWILSLQLEDLHFGETVACGRMTAKWLSSLVDN